MAQLHATKEQDNFDSKDASVDVVPEEHISGDVRRPHTLNHIAKVVELPVYVANDHARCLHAA